MPCMKSMDSHSAVCMLDELALNPKSQACTYRLHHPRRLALLQPALRPASVPTMHECAGNAAQLVDAESRVNN